MITSEEWEAAARDAAAYAAQFGMTVDELEADFRRREDAWAAEARPMPPETEESKARREAALAKWRKEFMATAVVTLPPNCWEINGILYAYEEEP